MNPSNQVKTTVVHRRLAGSAAMAGCLIASAAQAQIGLSVSPVPVGAAARPPPPPVEEQLSLRLSQGPVDVPAVVSNGELRSGSQLGVGTSVGVEYGPLRSRFVANPFRVTIHLGAPQRVVSGHTGLRFLLPVHSTPTGEWILAPEAFGGLRLSSLTRPAINVQVGLAAGLRTRHWMFLGGIEQAFFDTEGGGAQMVLPADRWAVSLSVAYRLRNPADTVPEAP